jgi:hypothetical protein
VWRHWGPRSACTHAPAPVAVTPNARLQTVSYPKGTATAPKALIAYLFGQNVGGLAWTPSRDPADPATGRRRRKYGTKQRSSARAGEAMQVVLDNGETYSVRITGTHTAFLDFFLAEGLGAKVLNVLSERGTVYGPKPQTLTPG